jgi:hypothetical protein
MSGFNRQIRALLQAREFEPGLLKDNRL